MNNSHNMITTYKFTNKAAAMGGTILFTVGVSSNMISISSLKLITYYLDLEYV